MILQRRFPPGSRAELEGSGTRLKVLVIDGHRRYVHAEHWSAWLDVGRLRMVTLWPGQKPGTHDHKPYHDECPDNCPGRLPRGIEYRVRPPRRMMAQARHA